MTIPLLPVNASVPGLTPTSAANPATGNAAAGEQPNIASPVFSAALTLALGQVAAVMQKAATGHAPETPSAREETLSTGDSEASPESAVTLPPTSCALPAAPEGLLAVTGGETADDPDGVELASGLGGAPHDVNGGPSELSPDMANGIAAAVTAATAALTAGSTSTVSAPVESNGIRRSLDLLAPEFRERLERVIDRMKSEFGYTVEVVETRRSQSRQDALYARGRTESGQVVTWTRASNHTVGHAADLVIDGSYGDALPYERLARIASEEGLRTLGARDPGHVELAPAAHSRLSSSSSSRNTVAPSVSDLPHTVIGRAAPSVASVASIVPSAAELQSRMPAVVASVATVARVARVADVARVAQVGASQSVTSAVPSRRSAQAGGTHVRPVAQNELGPEAPAQTQTAPMAGSPIGPLPATVAAFSGAGRSSANAEAADAEPNARRSRPERATAAGASATASEVLRQVRDDLMQAVAGTDPNATSSLSNAGASPVAGVAHTDMSERIARLLKVQDAAGDRPLSQVLLRLERPDGGEDRVRVDLRGSAISATLDVGDQAAADKLGANVKELQRALERHGFETEALTVRSATRSVESATIARAVSAAAESDLQRAAASASPNNTSSRDRGARHDEQRPSPDSQRHRARRDQKGDR